MSDWKLPDGVDRMAVNAALTTLTERWDTAAANLIVYAFHRLPADRRYRTEILRHHGSGDSVTGYTPEHGDVTVRDTRGSVSEHGGPRNSARIGQFKVYLIARGTETQVVFRPYWASDPSTAVEPPSEWHLWYCSSDLAPLVLIRIDWVPGSNPRHALWVAFRNLLTGRQTECQFWYGRPTVVYASEKCRIRK